MDTIIIRDTVFQAVNNTMLTTSEMADIYKEIINSQTQIYNSILYVFLGLVALAAGITWFYNTRTVKSKIKKETENIFNEEKVKIITDIKSEYEIELNYLKAERARLFANSITDDKCYSHMLKFRWRMEAIYYYNKTGKGEATRHSVTSAIETLKKALQDIPEAKKIYEEKMFADAPVNMNEIIRSLPDELNPEKEKLKKMLAEIETGIVKDNKKH